MDIIESICMYISLSVVVTVIIASILAKIKEDDDD
jgi:hypothetical protein